jgi:hypothetical protein
MQHETGIDIRNIIYFKEEMIDVIEYNPTPW